MVVNPKARFLAEDIWDTPDDGNRYEVIDGELYVSPPPKYAHQNIVTELAMLLRQHARHHRLGDVVVAPVGVVLDDGTAVQPDIVFIANDRLEIISERGVEGAPTLVVEVLSLSTASRDRGIKMHRYSASGIEHYWIIDPHQRTLEAY